MTNIRAYKHFKYKSLPIRALIDKYFAKLLENDLFDRYIKCIYKRSIKYSSLQVFSHRTEANVKAIFSLIYAASVDSTQVANN